MMNLDKVYKSNDLPEDISEEIRMQEQLDHLQVESHYWQDKAQILTVADIPTEVLIWFSNLKKQFTKFECEAFNYRVDIDIKRIK